MYSVVLDTNIFLVGLLPKHKYGWVMEALKMQKFKMCVSNEIILEYQEKIEQKYNVPFSKALIDNLLQFKNVKMIHPYYNWNLITKDPDDNKFVDCAVAGSVDFIVSNDKHFRILDQIDFPKLKVLQLEDFGKIIGML